VLLALGNYRGAVDAYRKAIEVQPDFVQGYSNILCASDFDPHATNELIFSLSRDWQLNAKCDGCGSAQSKATTAELTEDSIAKFNSANFLMESGDLNGARLIYETILESDPSFAPALNNLGIVMAKMGDAELARQCFTNSISANPNDSDPHNNLGRLLMERADFPGALAAFNDALSLNPGHVEALSNQSCAYTRSGLISLALEAADKALSLDQNFCDAWINRGKALIGAGDARQALSAFRRALEIDPVRSAVRSNIIYALHYLGGTEAELDSEQKSFGAQLAGLGKIRKVSTD